MFFYLSLIKDNILYNYEDYLYLNKIKNINNNFNSNFKDNIHNFFPLIKIIPFILFLATILIIIIFEKKLNLENYSFFVVLNPSFIFVFLFLNEFIFSFLLFLIGLLFLLDQKYFLTLFFFILAILFNPYFFYIIIVSLALFYSINSQKKVFSFLIILTTSILFSMLKIKDSFNIISDFGNIGISIFTLILSLVGLIYHIKNNKEKNFLIYITIIFLYLVSQYYFYFIIFLTLILAYFASYSYKKINDSQWHSTIFKNFVLLLIFCGLLFSTLSFLNNQKKEMLEKKDLLAYEWLSDHEQKNTNKNIIDKENNDKENNKVNNKVNNENNNKQNNKYSSNSRVVLNYYKNGYILSYYNLTPYVDLNYYNSGKRLKIENSEKILKSRNLKEIISFLKENNIKYIFIDENLKELIGKKENEGILLILKTSKYFKKIYYYQNIEIYEFLGNL
ncbi:MAG: hypothetical protein QXR96_00935 [Candidatus Woesearchaeota archaeon]